MMKHAITLAVAALFAITATPLAAQNDSKLGSFFRQVGERATGMNLSDELIISMPPELARCVGINEVCATADTATGDVTVTLSVEATRSHRGCRLKLGCEPSDHATDTKGKRYALTLPESQEEKEQSLDHAAPVIFQFIVKGLPKESKMIEMLSLAFRLSTKRDTMCSTDKGMYPITVRNVKIEN